MRRAATVRSALLISSLLCAQAAPMSANRADTEAACAPSTGLTFVCGAGKPEDLAHIPHTPWLIISGFDRGSGLKLIDTRSDTLSHWYTGAAEQIRRTAVSDGACSTAPDVATFNVQGIHLRESGEGRYRLLATNHGGRESIEMFDVDVHGPAPTLSWVGCWLLPDGVAANAVSSFSDGTILFTELARQGTQIADFVRGEKTGAVYSRGPGERAFRKLPGTELPGNNGLETSKDGTEFYVVAFGWHAVVTYSRADTRKPLSTVTAPGFMPDNIHWDAGRLLAGGMQLDEPACGGLRRIIDGKADGMLCHRGYTVAEFDPRAGKFRIVAYAEPDPFFNGVSGAVIIAEELWLSSYQSGRIAHRHLPAPQS
jgi:hypothetical protein